jgi:putative ABC transport system ATP-binding protein
MNESTLNSPIVTLQGVDLKLKSDAGEVHILKDINLNLERGRTVSITGPSGSGKTSLLMVLSGLERATGGKITVAGQDLSGMGEDGLATFRRDHIGIVFQNFHLIPTMNALENVAVPLELRGEKDAFAKAKEALEQVGLGHRLTHYPGQLSGGEQQRTALARAFATKPHLILADEPTGNLDAATGEKVLEILFGLAEKHGTTLLIVTHDPKLADRCQQAVKIADGRIAA